MLITKHIHKGYRKTDGDNTYYGKRHYFFEKDNNEISMISINYPDQTIREILFTEDGVMHDEVEQFKTKTEALKRIEALFDEPIPHEHYET